MRYIHLPWSFCEDLSQDYTLSDEAFRHLVHVLRIPDKAEIVAFNGCGELRLGHLCCSRKAGHIEFTEPISVAPVSKRVFNLVQCLPNNIATFEEILRKACELGIQNIYPILSDRSEKSVWRADLWVKRQERFQRILRESCKQAKNPFLPQLHTIASLKDLDNKNMGHCYFGSLSSEKNFFPKFQNETLIACVVGPEGGFSVQEESFLSEFSTPIQLPTYVLRVETAVVALIATLKTMLA